MGLRTRTAFSAEVRLGGIDAGQVNAVVTLDAHGRSYDPRDIVGFVAMLIVAVMRGCRNAPEVAQPYVELCRAAAGSLLDIAPDSARVMRLRDLVDVGTLDASFADAASVLAAGIPAVTSDPGARPHRRLRAELKLPRRNGAPFVALHSANAYIAAMGTFAIMEYIAHTHHYPSVTRPTAATVIRLLDAAEEMDASPVPDFTQATMLYLLANSLALGDEPPAPTSQT